MRKLTRINCTVAGSEWRSRAICGSAGTYMFIASGAARVMEPRIAAGPSSVRRECTAVCELSDMPLRRQDYPMTPAPPQVLSEQLHRAEAGEFIGTSEVSSFRNLAEFHGSWNLA